MMRVAIPHWQGRISPVFDVAGNLLLVDVADDHEQGRRDVAVTGRQPQARVRQLLELDADVLVCGAVSWPLEAAIVAGGIEVVSQTCGDVEEVLAAFIKGELNQDAFLMPGCCGRRRRFQGGRGGRCRRRGRKGGGRNAQR